MDEVAVRSATWRSRSTNAPPQMNKILLVSICGTISDLAKCTAAELLLPATTLLGL